MFTFFYIIGSIALVLWFINGVTNDCEIENRINSMTEEELSNYNFTCGSALRAKNNLRAKRYVAKLHMKEGR